MLGATIVALEYELFEHVDELTSRARRISIGELIVLSGMMLAGIVAFIARRARDSQRDVAVAMAQELDVQRLRDEAARDPLTELPNRRGLLSALAAATDGQRRTGDSTPYSCSISTTSSGSTIWKDMQLATAC